MHINRQIGALVSYLISELDIYLSVSLIFSRFLRYFRKTPHNLFINRDVSILPVPRNLRKLQFNVFRCIENDSSLSFFLTTLYIKM